MAKILCAIRGGEESRRLQDIAIQRAKERGEQIVFLYVVNTEFLDTASASLRESVTLEMEKLGDFLLLMAQERAKKEGVVAEPLLQHGYLQPEIKAAASQPEITTVLLGVPGERGNFSMESLQATAKAIEDEYKVEVLIV